MAAEAWALAEQQEYAISRQQLLAIGYSARAVEVRVGDARLHPVFAGVYAVGRPHLTRRGYFIAAVLACGQTAGLSHHSCAEHYGVRPRVEGPIHVSVLAGHPRPPGIKVHRRKHFDAWNDGKLRLTSPVQTLIDIARDLNDAQLERAINEASNKDLVALDDLRAAARGRSRQIRRLLERDRHVVTDSVLEQRLARIARRAGLPSPDTQRRLPGGRVDFYWPQHELIVEADSLRFHRTPTQQRADRLRDQRNLAAGIRTLRFTHWQVMREPEHVEVILRAVAA